MSTSSNPIFSGNSRYASDFQTIINNSVARASLPMQQLSNQKSNLSSQSNALSDLDSKVAALQTAIQNISSATTGTNALCSSVSDSSILQASVGEGAVSGSYTVEVTSLGSSTSTMSNDGLPAISDPSNQNISSSLTFTLTVNGTNYAINPEGNSLNDLVTAINGVAGAPVHASVVNVGPAGSPDYRLSVQGTDFAADTIQVNDGSANLLNTLATGANAGYKVNGMTTAIQTSSRSVILAPGVTVQLLSQSLPGVPATVTVSQNTASLENSLSAFASAYNAIVDALNAQRGQGAGVLSGQSIINTLGQSLRQITSFSDGSGTANSIESLGLTFDDSGKLSLDPSVFDQAISGNAGAVLSFLGSSGGSGFLQTATNVLDSLEDATSGVIESAIGSLQNQMAHQDQLIADEQARLAQLQQSLNHQMAASDALIASMEQQVNYITGLFNTMLYNTQLYSK